MLNEIRRKPEDGRRGGAWVLAQIPLLLLTFALPAVLPAAVLPWPAGTHPWREYLGLALGASGLLLAGLGLIRLGPNLTPLPRPKEGGALVTTGVYGLVRHPIYGGIVLLAFGSALRAATWLVVPLALLVLLFFSRKAALEERWLTEKFADYEAYRRRTASLIPWIY